MKIRLKSKYSGQVLAVVLVVMVVGVIIALSLISGSGSEQRQVKEEDFSASALEIADSALDGVLGVDFALLSATYCDNYTGPDVPISTLSTSCVISDPNKLKDLMNESIYEQIIAQLTSECNEEDPEAVGETNFKIIIDKVDITEEKEIKKDKTVSLVFNSPVNNACQVHVTPTASSSSPVGLISSAIYAQVDGSGDVTSYLPYSAGTSDSTIRGYCLNDACWTDRVGDWLAKPNPTFQVGIANNGHYLNELRLRAVGADVKFRYELLPADQCTNVSAGNMYRVSSQAYCNSQFRGIEYIVTEESAAPAIFDYVLFNGADTLTLGE